MRHLSDIMDSTVREGMPKVIWNQTPLKILCRHLKDSTSMRWHQKSKIVRSLTRKRFRIDNLSYIQLIDARHNDNPNSYIVSLKISLTLASLGLSHSVSTMTHRVVNWMKVYSRLRA